MESCQRVSTKGECGMNLPEGKPREGGKGFAGVLRRAGEGRGGEEGAALASPLPVMILSGAPAGEGPAPVLPPEIIDMVHTSEIIRTAEGGEWRLEIGQGPLAGLRLRLIAKDSTIEAHLISEDRAMCDMLASQADSLRSHLEARGLDVAAVTVSSGGEGKDQRRSRGHGPWPDAPQAPRRPLGPVPLDREIVL